MAAAAVLVQLVGAGQLVGGSGGGCVEPLTPY